MMNAMLSLSGIGMVLAMAAPAAAAPKPVTVALDRATYRVSGPYKHGNLSVFMLHAGAKDRQDYITLAEGVKAGLVKVTEKDQGQVSELLITNNSAKPLFLQEGERVVGGKQDRMVSSSLVIPPKSVKVPLPAFCVEAGRWTEGHEFSASASPALAPKSVREAAKVNQSQGQVWDRVAKEKRVARTRLNAPSATTSLSETMDSAPVRKAADKYVAALGGLSQKHPDAVGVAMAVNGRVEEVNLYPNHRLLAQMYPRLLRSYALEAAGNPMPVVKNVTTASVAQFMKAGGSVQKKFRRIDQANALSVYSYGGANRMDTTYNGAPVHQQFMRSTPDAPTPQQQAPMRRR